MLSFVSARSHGVTTRLPAIAALVATLIALTGFAFATNETVVLAFDQTNGMTPLSGFVVDSKDNLYGVTSIGGTGNCSDFGGGAGCGTVYELSPPSKTGEAWTETVLYNFQGGADGDEVVGSLVFDKNGNLYGTTALGGGGACTYGCGTVFELSPPAVKGDPWTKTTLYTFQGGTSDGSYPESTLVFDSLGNLYGTTQYGGGPNCAGYGCGTVFELSPPAKTGKPWTESVLHKFVGPTNGDAYAPAAGLVFDTAGNLYGTAPFGGTYNNGAIFALNPPAKTGGTWTESVIYSFIGAPDGAGPEAALTPGTDGVFYGTASGAGPAGFGSVFKITPPAQKGAAWTLSVLYSFDLSTPGGNPFGPVLLAKNGDLYGTTLVGGDYSCNEGYNDGCGVVYQIAPTSKGTWKQAVLHSFMGGTDGMEPASSLVIGKYGYLYGTTESGGASGAGTVFSVVK